MIGLVQIASPYQCWEGSSEVCTCTSCVCVCVCVCVPVCVHVCVCVCVCDVHLQDNMAGIQQF